MLDRIRFFFINNKKILLIAAALLLIIVIVIFSIPKQQKEEAPADKNMVPGESLILTQNTKKQELTPEEKISSGILVVAKNFAEIYGTYSNQSNYINLEAVLPLLSSRYRAEISEILSNLRVSYIPEAEYEGTTTVAVSNTTESLDDAAGTAVVLVKTQRKISERMQSDYTIKYQDIRLNLVKEGDVWLVDSAKWLMSDLP